MATRRVRFTFEGENVGKPVIYELGHEFKVVTNIRMADVERGFGWVVLELEGAADEIDASLKWAADHGVRIDPVTGDIVDG
jgi:ABC-type methionine transport system ATPase subunit